MCESNTEKEYPTQKTIWTKSGDETSKFTHHKKSSKRRTYNYNQESKLRGVKQWQIKDNRNRLSFHRQLSLE